MAKIIQINKLYDRYHEMVFGYVGMDIITGNIKYYSFYDETQKYNPNMLYEFDKDNLNETLLWHMSYCAYSRPTLSKDLPNIFENLRDELINEHIKFNEE